MWGWKLGQSNHSKSVFFSIKALDEFATKLIQNNHYAKEDVATRRDAVRDL